ncbi:hypothetical protein EST38_g12248 [Candolleomyces aberdarensis]|uniref:Transcriptional repressor Tup1 N-terminal domain-containing protein n=1 Tax=Candolleomyces aberdarensis TaxID=2316362 RepID=A0A4V1Q225_9AGAR|nr:hypothetical protein EST38_g12248 [Candolleomyces aberdarensis]
MVTTMSHSGLAAVAARLGESMEVIRGEYEHLAGELGYVKGQKDEFEAKAHSQMNELGIIRQSLYDLETQHTRLREQFEQELARLRAELRVARQQQASASANPPPPANQPGAGGASGGGAAGGAGGGSGGGLSGPGLGGGMRGSPDQSIFYKPPGSGAGKDRDRERERDRDRERIPDLRETKRMRVDSLDSAGGSPRLPSMQTAPGPSGSSANGAMAAVPGTPSNSTKLPALGSGSRAAMKERERAEAAMKDNGGGRAAAVSSKIG